MNIRNPFFGVLILAIPVIALIFYAYNFTPLVRQPSSTEAPLVTALPTISPTSSATQSSPNTQTINIYFVAIEDNGKRGPKIGCNDSLLPVQRTIAPTDEVEKAALQELLSFGARHNEVSGLYNSLASSNLRIESFQITNGIAKVKLSGSILLGGTCDTPRFEEQLKATVLQFPNIREVEFLINNQPIKEALSQR